MPRRVSCRTIAAGYAALAALASQLFLLPATLDNTLARASGPLAAAASGVSYQAVKLAALYAVAACLPGVAEGPLDLLSRSLAGASALLAAPALLVALEAAWPGSGMLAVALMLAGYALLVVELSRPLGGVLRAFALVAALSVANRALGWLADALNAAGAPLYLSAWSLLYHGRLAALSLPGGWSAVHLAFYTAALLALGRARS
ncbi:MAG: hypothetical protein LRS49_02475 [Desulfurococcales archaeon]|nr:hypothetical protein [Desulfurococcales archaeon]